MRRAIPWALLAGVLLVAVVQGYVEAPYTLGQTIHESTNIVHVEVVKVVTENDKNLIYFKKIADLKGKHPKDEIKHNIGKRGFHAREWQTIMQWAKPGQRAVFFHNGGASETCIGHYWYQAFPEGEWWGLSHAEPFMLRTFNGDADYLAKAVTAIVEGREAVVPCFTDQPNRELYHQRQGKMQLLKASLKRLNYDPKRDFVGFGNDPGNIQEYRTTVLLPQTTPGWKFTVDSAEKKRGNQWLQPNFDEAGWQSGQSPIGYGEEEIGKRRGTTISEKGKSHLFRRAFDVPADLLMHKDAQFRLSIASDDSAIVWINGQEVDRDPQDDHEFAYWNRDIELPRDRLAPGRNVVAVFVKNSPGSSDLYLDLEITVQVPLPKKPEAKK